MYFQSNFKGPGNQKPPDVLLRRTAYYRFYTTLNKQQHKKATKISTDILISYLKQTKEEMGDSSLIFTVE